MKKNNMVITVVVAVVVAALAFFGGMKYQESKTLAATGGQFVGRGQFGQGGQRHGGGFGGATVGTIASIDADSLTIKLQDGSSKIVDLAGSTTYSKTDTGSKADLQVGARIAAIGSANSDGSITAQNIQLNPMFRGPGQGSRPSGAPAQ